jgi:hypothetical protein
MRTPRILILDNDETTGSYNLLFHLYDLFAIAEFGTKLDVPLTMTALTRSFKSLGVFRPGLTRLLLCASTLKCDERLDKVVMYTNQLDIRQIRDAPKWKCGGIEWSVPMIIQVMLVYLGDNPKLIDAILTRPLETELRVGDYPVKDFVRAFRTLYPTGSINLSKTLFLDDLADHPFVIDSSKSETDTNSRMKLNPYVKKLDPSSFWLTVRACLTINNITPSESDLELIMKYDSTWNKSNDKLEDQHVDDSLEHLIPLLKTIYSKEN